MVKFSFDPKSAPALTESQQAQLAALRNKPDSEIDCSDLPEPDTSFWNAASRV